ncbi:MIZ/SP-RING zinc finger-domain-containing protein [Pilaira anomala]|nr:MIZ/SP-RING zinc finger-domain-containing protein [Pilaira anomala]
MAVQPQQQGTVNGTGYNGAIAASTAANAIGQVIQSIPGGLPSVVTPRPSVSIPQSPIASPTRNNFGSPNLTSATLTSSYQPLGKAVSTPVMHPAGLHLPPAKGQENVKRAKTLDPENDRVRFRYKKEYAVKPFRLSHGQEVSGKSFFLPRPDFDNLCTNDTMMIGEGDTFPLRFVLTSWYKEGPERKCQWPENLHIDLNGRRLPLEKRIKNTQHPGPPYYGKDSPYDLTKQLRIGENTLKIYQPECACHYTFAVQIYKQFSINAAKRMVDASTIKIDETEKLIRNFFGQVDKDDDDDIVIVQKSVKLSLRCPISLKKLKLPIRGRNCKHLECFDLVPYLLTNENKVPQWLCPCCNKTTYPDELARDLFMERLLKTLQKNVVEIEFQDPKNYTITKVDDPDSDDEDNGRNDEKEGESDDKKKVDEPIKNEEYAVAELPSNVTIIDLISDDEEEEGGIEAGIETRTTTNQSSKRSRED